MVSPQRPDIVVVGAGVASAVGTGCGALWAAISEGRDGLRDIQRFAVDRFQTRLAGLWPGWDGRQQPGSEAPAGTRVLSTSEIAVVAAREAWAAARLEADTSPHRIAVVLGTCFGEDFVGFSELTESIAAALGARGPCLTLSTACSSSTAAIGLGRDLIEHGFADLVFAGGADVLTREVFAGFHALGALSVEKCSPLGEVYGTTLGEGAGFVVLESAARAARRGVEAWSTVLGYGLSGDAFHDTSPDPSGSGIARAIRAALADACAEGRDIDYVNLHATGTQSNDIAEAAGLRASLGARADEIPASATKSFLGHAQGAAGVLETVASLLCARRGVVPPTLRCARPRPCAPCDPVAANRPRAHVTRRFLKVSAAFGGANAALVMGASVRPRIARDRRVVEVIGISAIGPHGSSLEQLEERMTQGRSLAGAVLNLDETALPRWDPRGLDPSARFATTAAALALADAEVVVRGALRDRIGLFTGNSRCPARSAWECRSSIEQRGLGGVSPIAFAHMTLNAPAGACAKQLSLRGPLLALSTGRGSGLGALACAAQHLASRDDADLMLAGGLDELPIEAPQGHAEGAAFALLRAGPLRQSGQVCVEGWGIAGAADLPDAIAAALAGLPRVDGVFAALPRSGHRSGARAIERLRAEIVDVEAMAGGAEATASAFAFVLAASKLRRREAARLLVVSAGDSMSSAVVLGIAGSRA